MPKVPLMDPSQNEISMLDEIIKHKREEVRDMKITLENLRARITSERAQWSSWKSDEERKIKLKDRQLEDQWLAKNRELDQLIHQQEVSLANQQKIEQEAERLSAEIVAKNNQLGNLNQERLEIETLRKQVNERSDQVESRWSASQDALVKGNNAIKLAEQVKADVEKRNLRLNELDTDIKKREEAVIIREKNLELATKELDKKLEQPKEEKDA